MEGVKRGAGTATDRVDDSRGGGDRGSGSGSRGGGSHNTGRGSGRWGGGREGDLRHTHAAVVAAAAGVAMGVVVTAMAVPVVAAAALTLVVAAAGVMATGVSLAAGDDQRGGQGDEDRHRNMHFLPASQQQTGLGES